jgi:hypothetical protein
MQPAGTEDWGEARLQALVSRNSMIGVELAKPASTLAQRDAES